MCLPTPRTEFQPIRADYHSKMQPINLQMQPINLRQLHQCSINHSCLLENQHSNSCLNLQQVLVCINEQRHTIYNELRAIHDDFAHAFNTIDNLRLNTIQPLSREFNTVRDSLATLTAQFNSSEMVRINVCVSLRTQNCILREENDALSQRITQLETRMTMLCEQFADLPMP